MLYVLFNKPREERKISVGKFLISRVRFVESEMDKSSILKEDENW